MVLSNLQCTKHHCCLILSKKKNTFFDCLSQWNIINHCQPLSDFPSPNHGNHPNYFIEANSYDTQPCRSALLPCSAQAFQALCYCSMYQGMPIFSAFTLLLALSPVSATLLGPVSLMRTVREQPTPRSKLLVRPALWYEPRDAGAEHGPGFHIPEQIFWGLIASRRSGHPHR